MNTALRRCIPDDYRQLIGWIPDRDALFLFTGPLLTWPLTIEQFEALESTPRRTDWALVGDDTTIPLGHVEITEIEPTRRSGRLNRVIVSPERRGEGLGKVLIGLALDESRAQGLREIDLMVIHGNEPAIRTYEHFGFVVRESESLPHALNMVLTLS